MVYGLTVTGLGNNAMDLKRQDNLFLLNLFWKINSSVCYLLVAYALPTNKNVIVNFSCISLTLLLLILCIALISILIKSPGILLEFDKHRNY